MSHIHTEPGHHDATVSAFIFRTDNKEPKVVLHLHKKIKSYMQFGGHIELHENPWQAVTHEIVEESGYSLEQLSLLQPVKRIKKLSGTKLHPYPVVLNTHTFPGIDHFHSDITFAFITNVEPREVIGEEESKEVSLFTKSEILELPSDKILENVREIALFIFDELLNSWEPVPADSV